MLIYSCNEISCLILEVKISKIATAAVLFECYSSLAGFIINKNQNGEEITVDFILPTITVVIMIFIMIIVPLGWLRFSPNSPAVDDYTDTNPDYVNIKLGWKSGELGQEMILQFYNLVLSLSRAQYVKIMIDSLVDSVLLL